MWVKFPAMLHFLDSKMAPLFNILFLVQALIYICNGKVKEDIQLEWPSKYHVKVEVINMMDSHTQHIEAWYAEKYNWGRMDILDAGVKKYYIDDKMYMFLVGRKYLSDTREGDDPYPLIYVIRYCNEINIHPETTNEELNVLKCFKSKDNGVFDVLPPIPGDPDYKGKMKFNEIEVDVYEKNTRNSLGTAEIKLYVYKDGRYDIPLHWEARTFDAWSGALESHTINNYYYYSPRVTKDDIDVSKAFDTSECVKEDSLSLTRDLDFLHYHNRFDFELVFNSYQKYHGKMYKHKEEDEMRRAIFLKNWRKVVGHNQKNLSYQMELNEFADRTNKELHDMSCLHRSKPSDRGTHPVSEFELMQQAGTDLPEEYDLRILGAITPVKSQLSCGSCWSFAATATIEGALALRLDRTLDLSEQSLVDCAWGYECKGCNGGELSGALRYAYTYGIPTEKDYGMYLAEDSYCTIDNMTDVHKIKGFSRITPRSESSIKAALLRNGPVVVGIYVTSSMYMYSHGVYFDIECPTGGAESINHGVVIVGYGVRDGSTYWIVKNSWGTKWGEAGYLLMSAEQNNCFIEDEAYVVIV